MRLILEANTIIYLLRSLVNFNGLGRKFSISAKPMETRQESKDQPLACTMVSTEQNRVLESTPRNCSNVIRLFGSRASSQDVRLNDF